MKKRFLIIDAFGILYRYHFIFLKRPLLNSKGENVSSINGFLRTYFSLLDAYPSDYVAIALDSSRKTFRSEIYKEYKENRESMPDDLRSQIPILYELIDALGISRIVLDNYEADDIIGYIAERNKKENIKTIIYSPDKDILQLVDKDVNVVASNKDNELIEIMTFGKPRYNKNYEWELLRLCSHKDYKIVGGAERLFNHFIKTYTPVNIISYCDYSKFSGDVYSRLDFVRIGKISPSKHWSKGKQHITDNLLRQRGYDQLFGTNYGKGTSNEELMLKNNWLPVYDCGQLTFIYK